MSHLTSTLFHQSNKKIKEKSPHESLYKIKWYMSQMRLGNFSSRLEIDTPKLKIEAQKVKTCMDHYAHIRPFRSCLRNSNSVSVITKIQWISANCCSIIFSFIFTFLANLIFHISTINAGVFVLFTTYSIQYTYIGHGSRDFAPKFIRFNQRNLLLEIIKSPRVVLIS